MAINTLPVNQTAYAVNKAVEKVVNFAVRSYDRVARPLGLGIRVSNYDDLHFAFDGGVGDKLRQKHYDKSLRLLWKAEAQAPYTSFKDCSRDEKRLMELGESAMNTAEKKQLKRIRSSEFKELLNKHYSQEQKQAIVNILSIIGHGEAYAWIVSNQLLSDVKSTGGRAAMTMQVLEEAKHFVVLREVLQAFDCPIPRMLAYEYALLESIVRQSGLEKFFGMNVLVEGIALSLFGLMGGYPGLEVLKMFHLDESRHTALPHSYFEEFPMTRWQKFSPVAMTKRSLLILPLVPLLLRVEKDLAVLGIDVFDFAGSVVRKIMHLSYRVGFYLPLPQAVLGLQMNLLFNSYCYLTRKGHHWKNYMQAETTTGEAELAIEREVFYQGAVPEAGVA